MKLNRHKDFINESKDQTVHVKYMNNKDRKILQDFLNVIKINNVENLPNYMKMYIGEVEDKIASYIYNPREHKEILQRYFVTGYDQFNTLYDITRLNVGRWDDRKILSNDLIEELIYDLESVLSKNDENNIMNDITHEIYLLSDEEEKALPSLKTIDKYNL